jgi:hypothetical protein
MKAIVPSQRTPPPRPTPLQETTLSVYVRCAWELLWAQVRPSRIMMHVHRPAIFTNARDRSRSQFKMFRQRARSRRRGPIRAIAQIKRGCCARLVIAPIRTFRSTKAHLTARLCNRRRANANACPCPGAGVGAGAAGSGVPHSAGPHSAGTRGASRAVAAPAQAVPGTWAQKVPRCSPSRSASAARTPSASASATAHAPSSADGRKRASHPAPAACRLIAMHKPSNSNNSSTDVSTPEPAH